MALIDNFTAPLCKGFCPNLDGLIGLSVSANYLEQNFPIILSALKDQSLIQRGIFSIFLNRFNDSVESSEIAFGGYNPDLVEDINKVSWFHTVYPDSWETTFSGYSMGEAFSFWPARRMTALFDTGSTFIVFPKSIHDEFLVKLREFHKVNCTRKEGSLVVHLCEGDFTKMPAIELRIGDKPFFVNASRYIKGRQLFIVPNPSMVDSVNIGMTFMREHYMIFDREERKIGIVDLSAKAKAGKRVSGIVPEEFPLRTLVFVLVGVGSVLIVGIVGFVIIRRRAKRNVVAGNLEMDYSGFANTMHSKEAPKEISTA
jgi:hypothetical protein